MYNYLTSFRLLTHLGANNIRAINVLNKIRLRKFTIIEDSRKKKGMWLLWEAHIKQIKQYKVDSGWFEKTTERCS